MNQRRNNILDFARRCGFDEAHAQQVECLAGTLFLALEPLHQLNPDDRRLLEYSALLHDIGYSIAGKGHHRHGMNLVLMEPLTDFSNEEKLMIANLVRYHRKSLPTLEHAAFSALPDSCKLRIGLLAPLLRIADALDRSHAQSVQEMNFDIGDATISLFLGAENELPTEMAALSRKIDMFRHVYKRDLEIHYVLPRLQANLVPDLVE